MLSYPLRKEGYHVTSALDGTEALQRFDEGRFDLVVLDLMLPRRDGVEVCRELRARSQVPIIMLTAKGSESDKVAGLEVGADDYITKPFSMREFRSRVKAALRRSRMVERRRRARRRAARSSTGDLTIDFDRRLVTLADEEIRVTYVEFEILGALARSPGRVLTRETLLEHVWGDSEYRDPRTVDVHIRHLREKIERDPKEPRVPLHRARRRLPLRRVDAAGACDRAASAGASPSPRSASASAPSPSSTYTWSRSAAPAPATARSRRQIIVGGLIAAALALADRHLLRDASPRATCAACRTAARKVADGNFETTIPVASVGQLAPLARTFNEMQRRLAELDSARKQFIANASHELRTPIFSLGGFVELLEEEDDRARPSGKSSCARCAGRSSG